MSELTVLYQEVRTCQKCILSQGRTNAVPGEGPKDAEIMFIGEAPGFHEDRQGRPFVGAAGKYLEDLLATIDLDREEVYIANVIKCRPPGNRNPEPDEISACLPFLHRQIVAIKPRYICTLGAVAAQTLLDTQAPIGRLRGRFHAYRGIPLMPTYHPAYLLRNPEHKRDVWQDVQKLMAALGDRKDRRATESTPD